MLKKGNPTVPGEAMKLGGTECQDDRRQFFEIEHQVDLAAHNVRFLFATSHERAWIIWLKDAAVFDLRFVWSS